VAIKGVTEDHKRTAGVEGEKREVENEAKRRSEENPNVPPAQIIHIVAGQVQETEVEHQWTERNSLTRNMKGTQNKKW
jgi:hypothetical protein